MMDGSLSHHTAGTFLLRFGYDPDLVTAVKAIPTARWDAEERGWVVNEVAADETLAFCKLYGFEVFDEVHDALARTAIRVRDAEALAHERMRDAGEEFWYYQPQGVRFLAERRVALLAWGQRTGKTPISLTAAFPDHPVVVVTPAGVAYQWGEEEGPKFRPDLEWEVLEGRGSFRWPRPREGVVTNWAILPPPAMQGKWVRPLPGSYAGTVLLVDEGHMAKNPKAQRTKAMRSMIRGVLENDGYVWFLTASPMANSPLELWNLLQTMQVAKLVFGSFDTFMRLYHAKREFGQIVWGRPKPEVRDRLDRVMHRVTMRDVRKDIPPFIHSFVPVHINMKTSRAELWLRDYARWEDAVGKGKASVVTDGLLATVRKDMAWAKTPAAVKLVEAYEQDKEPVVVFSAHLAPIEHLGTRKGWGKITGSESPRQKNEVKRAFQMGKLKGVACVIRAGALGITLNRAKEMIFIDLDWNPEENAQAQMRCVAVDQKEPVRIRTLIAAGTPDEAQLRDLDFKTRQTRETLERPPPRRRKQA